LRIYEKKAYISRSESVPSGGKWLANAKGNPSIPASCALKPLEPNNQIGMFKPFPGIAFTYIFSEAKAGLKYAVVLKTLDHYFDGHVL
jgi:hypothetical protein